MLDSVIASRVEAGRSNTFFSVTVHRLLALQPCFFGGMALQCGKYLQGKIFE